VGSVRHGFHSAPTIGPDGTIYFGCDAHLYAVNPDGIKKWSLKVDDSRLRTSPTISSDGTIYVTQTQWTELLAINPNGSVRWRQDFGWRFRASPALGPEGTLYATHSDGHLRAIYTGVGGLADSAWPTLGQNNKRTGRREKWDVSAFQLGVDSTFTTSPWDADRFSVEVDEGRNLLVEVKPGSGVHSMMLDVGFGDIIQPSGGTFSTKKKTVRGTYEALVAPTQAGTYYLAVFGTEVDQEGGTYEIVVRYVDAHLSDHLPRNAGWGGLTNLSVKGLRFEQGMAVGLSGPGLPSLSPIRTSHISPTEIVALFNFADASLGVYDLDVTWPGGHSEKLEDSFTIEPGTGPRLEVEIQPPAFVRPGRNYAAWLRYENTGDADMASPLLSIRSNVSMSVRKDSIDGRRVEILGVGGMATPDILRAGEARSVPIFFKTALDGTMPVFEVIEADDSATPVDWVEQKEIMRPPNLDPAEWDALWPDLRARLGNNWAEYIGVLRDLAIRMSQRGLVVHDVRELIDLETRVAAGLPVAAISGTLMRRGIREPLGGVTVRAVSTDGSVVREAITRNNPDGVYVIEHLPAGSYELWVEGYYLSPVPRVDVFGEDVSGLVLEALEYLPSPHPETIGTPRHNPDLVADEVGDVYAVWEEDGEIWWARYSSGAWNSLGPIPGAQGFEPVIVIEPDIHGDQTGLGLIVAWVSEASPATIEWTVGLPNGDSVDWFEPVGLTNDPYADSGVSLIAGGNGPPLALWLQQDLQIEDDSDLYHDILDFSALGPEFSLALAEDLTLDGGIMAVERCVGLPEIEFQGNLPKKVPILGGEYSFEMLAEICGSAGCSPELTGEASVKFKFGKLARIERGKTFEASWKTDREACRYVFDEAQFAIEAASGVGINKTAFTVRPYGIPINVVVGGEAMLFGGATLTWKSSLSGLPDQAEINFGVEGALDGEVLVAYGVIGGQVTGSVSLDGVFEVPPAEMRFEGYCVTLEGKAKAIWGMFDLKWDEDWGPSCPEDKRLLLADSMVVPLRNSLVFESVSIAATQTSTTLEITKDPLIGTGSVYEGLPVLGDISADFYNDGRPATTVSDSGERALVWAKDLEGSLLGGNLFTTSYVGGSWETPVEITDQTAFVKDPAALFDADGNLMSVWSSASNVGLSFDGSSVDQILDAIEEADIFYSMRIDGTWTAPIPVATIAGRDEQPAISIGADGEIIVGWLNHSESSVTLYTSKWDGAEWSPPDSIATAAAIEPPALAATTDGFMVLWAQDGDGDLDTHDDWSLFSSRSSVDNWSTPDEIVPLVVQKNSARKRAFAKALGDLNAKPPENCCEEPLEPIPPEPPGDLVDEATSEPIVSRDPNEKFADPGYGSEHLIQAGDQLFYEVHFENLQTATAPAQEVFVLDCLDPGLDWLSFRLRDVVFADTVVANTATTPVFSERVTIPDYRAGVEKQWWVDVETSFNLLNGCFRTILRQLDPDSGELPEDPFAGILPPEDGTGRGQGHLSYSVKTKDKLEERTVITNRASIIFDVNEPILTNEVFNTIGDPQFKLTVSTAGDGSGSLTSTPGGIDCGDVCEAMYIEGAEVELNHFAKEGSEFKEWGGDPDCIDGIVFMDADKTCEATFEISNQPPVAVAGDDQTLPADETCHAEASLDGSQSHDPDDDPLTYLWQSPFGDVPEALAQYSLPLGQHDFTLRVTDDDDASASDTVQVTVEDQMIPEISLNGELEMTIECNGDYAEQGATASDNCDEDVEVILGGDVVDPTTAGVYVVTCDATDDAGNQAIQVARTVTVADSTGPTIDSISATPQILWPPNHRMRTVTTTAVATDGCDSELPVCAITDVSSNEPETGCGSGNKKPDWEITGDMTVDLRAERCGNGDDRVYSIEVMCMDGHGNEARAVTPVVVPHDRGDIDR
jgi:hypothetical protein